MSHVNAASLRRDCRHQSGTSQLNRQKGPRRNRREAVRRRLQRLQGKRWKKLLNVQLPWKIHTSRLDLGRALDVGCGPGRMLTYLRSDSVGVDHNAYSVQRARERGVLAFTVEGSAPPSLTRPAAFDSLLAAHLIEHLQPSESREVIGNYLPFVKPGGRVVFFTPQERGYASDTTHVVLTTSMNCGRCATTSG